MLLPKSRKMLVFLLYLLVFFSPDLPKWYKTYFVSRIWVNWRSKTSIINSCWDMVVTPSNRCHYLKVEKSWFFFYIFWIFKSRPTKWYETYFISWAWMDWRSKTAIINSCWDMMVTPSNRCYYLKVGKCWFFSYTFWIF